MAQKKIFTAQNWPRIMFLRPRTFKKFLYRQKDIKTYFTAQNDPKKFYGPRKIVFGPKINNKIFLQSKMSKLSIFMAQNDREKFFIQPKKIISGPIMTKEKIL